MKPSKLSMMFLGAVPDCATPDGIWRAWSALPAPRPYPDEPERRGLAAALTSADVTADPRRWLAAHRRPECVRVAVQEVLRSWEFELAQPKSVTEATQAAEPSNADDRELGLQLARIASEAPRRPTIAAGRHPLVRLVAHYAEPDADLLAWISSDAYCTAVDVAFDATMAACAAAADRAVAAVGSETLLRPKPPPLAAPYDLVRLDQVALAGRGIRVVSTARTSSWAGFAALRDDQGGEYLQSGRSMASRRRRRGEKTTVEQWFYPAVRPDARQLHLVINIHEPTPSTIELELPQSP